MFKKQIKSSILCIIEQYKIYGNKLTHVKELPKQNYFTSMLNKYTYNAKKIWRLINCTITLKKTPKTTHVKIVDQTTRLNMKNLMHSSQMWLEQYLPR